MVFLALSRESALQAIAVANAGGHHVWVGANALSQDEHQAHVARGVRLTRFSHSLTDRDAVDEAVATIREHHPSDIIWVQHT